MRKITSHHDGHGLHESISITAIDKLGPGGANHQYKIEISDKDGKIEVGRIAYQYGPRNEPLSSPGITDSCLLAIVADRLSSFQNGPFNCEENEKALEHVRMAMDWMKTRADNRASRNVLGKNEV